MKVSVFISFFFSLQVLGQETKANLFVGIYESAKKGICSDYAYVSEEIGNYAGFAIKRKQFYETHKNNGRTQFVDKNQAIIIYQYGKKISGWNCVSNVISFKTGKSLEECNKQLTEEVAKNPQDFLTDPKTVFSWQSVSITENTSQYEKDFGGLKGVFLSASTPSKSIIVVKLTNTTKNKSAYVQLTTDGGKKHVEYIGSELTLTRKYDAKNLEISVVYEDSKKPKQSFELIQFIKSKVRDRVTSEEGKIKSVANSVGGSRG